MIAKHAVKRALCGLIALSLMLGGACMAEADTAQQVNSFITYEHDGRVTLIDGAVVNTPVKDFEAAAVVIDGVLDQLGGDGCTELEPWRVLNDAFGNRYFVFQQMYDNTTVLGGAVKVITDAGGGMLGLTASIEPNPSQEAVSEGIAAAEAEQIVLDNAMETRQQALNVLEGMTDRMILPITIGIDMEEETAEGSRYVWVVYTDNPDSIVNSASDLPYLAHYVTLTGEYLYSLPTIMPGDEASMSGFDASYVFEFMEPVNYTGYVDMSTGGEKEISVDVMRDTRTGMYYLGNLERRIVVADCWEFLYGGNRVVLEYSPDNLEWDQVGLLTLYNYCRAYDYYREIGWIGGDGLGTPILVLNSFCDENHVPVDNAAYVGGYLGWQIFLASHGNDLSQSLDVLAHEFTHCVTGSVMTYNAYQNDYGAINEAMSDIQGKTCEMLMDGQENVTWEIADQSAIQIRSMSEPHRFNQPEFTWDIYYVPNVRTPTLLNDVGGVHTNSSLLNFLAWRLYEKGGMTPEEGRAFWFAVDCAMVPGTDYAQLSELLPLTLRLSGMEQYNGELARAMDAVRLGVTEIPEVFDEDRALLTLRLPENEIFGDEQWVMEIFSVDVHKLFNLVRRVFGHVIMGDYSDLPPFVQEMLTSDETEKVTPEVSKNLFAALTDAIMGNGDDMAEQPTETAEQELSDEEISRIEAELTEWGRENLKDIFYLASTNAGQDGQTMRMVCMPGHAVPILLHGVFNENTSELEDAGYLIMLGGQWIDLGAMMAEMEAMETDEAPEEMELSEEMQALVDAWIDKIAAIRGIDDAMDLIFFRIEGGVENELPSTGLEAMQPVLETMPTDMMEEYEMPEPKKSRPKPEEPSDEMTEEAREALPDAA